MTTFLRKFSEKLTKLRLIINKIRDNCVKIEPEEYHSMDEQIIPTKRKHSSIPHYTSKKPNKWGFKNLSKAGSSGIMNNYHIYDLKGYNCGNEKYQYLSKSSQIVDLPGHVKHKVFFGKWFSSCDLLLYLKTEAILAQSVILVLYFQIGIPVALKILTKILLIQD